MELGIYTFAETAHDAGASWGTRAAERLRDLMEEIELADQVGSTPSASESITVPTTRSRRRRSSSPRRHSARSASG